MFEDHQSVPGQSITAEPIQPEPRAGEPITQESGASDPISQAPDEGGPISQERDRPSQRARLVGLLPALLLAALGLMGAVVAWRVAVAGNAAGDQDRAALNAARARASATLAAEQTVAQTTGAWLDFERAKQRAEALDAAGLHDAALQQKQIATAHWFLVSPDFLAADGTYNPDRHRQALINDAAANNDIDPAPHEANAESEYQRLNSLLITALVIVLALPLATFSEVSRGRWRAVAGISGLLVLLIGVGLLAAVW